MIPDPYVKMQKAVDIVQTSLHDTNKIAATLFGTDSHGTPYSISHTNVWPKPILSQWGTHVRIGGPDGSSGTIHAETACILAAPRTAGANLCITDPFCPNCAKNIAEAGIKTIYIDHKGFDKDFAARRADHFQTMSMQICEKAGISVYEIRRKDRVMRTILEHAPDYKPTEDNPVTIVPLPRADEATFLSYCQESLQAHENRRVSVALARNVDGQIFGLTARAHPAIGYSMAHDAADIENRQNKYTYILEPLNRVLMNAARHGLRIIDGYVYSALVPTAREQVNFIGAGLSKLHIGNQLKARDEAALIALKNLSDSGILHIYRTITA